ncbi:hypothetical protein CC80DRAFT_567501 [Byssothecium circinans]|uniref:Uncharacterized protein n=1 Tax=Byssothecium circinans TaxID=147558 RepID=A0A6A5TQR8_9PLEO|nr:hypothetical protein CC80DRAFT_567501 [Byssothecium circinans]
MPKELVGAIIILFLLFIFLITIVPVQIIVPETEQSTPGYRLTTSFKVAYNIVGTIIATIIARFAASVTQQQWLRYINHEISDVRYQLPRSPSIATRWRAVLGISTFAESIKNIKSTGLAQLSMLATALITAAIVAGVTLTDTTCISDVSPPRIHSGADNKCTRSIPTQDAERNSPLWEYRTFWDRDDGTSYFATTNLGCPSWGGSSNLLDINTVDPAKFAYARNGVAVKNSAIGVPEIFYTNFPKVREPLERPKGNFIIQSNLRTVTHCLPVMARNPVKCRPGGIVSYQSSSQRNNTITVDAGGCNSTQPSAEDPADPFGAMLARLCPAKNKVGQASVAFGATGIISFTLAAAMGDSDFLGKNAGKYEDIRSGKIKDITYAASCSIDVNPTIEWRTVTLEIQDGNLTTAPSYSKVVSGTKGCSAPENKKVNWNLGDGYAAGAVAALGPPLSEGRYWNGMTNTIFNVALRVNDTSARYSTAESWLRLIRNGTLGFNESTNALEDVLGLTTGITMSQMSTLGSLRPESPLSDPQEFYPPVLGNATFACTRVGSGSASALIFTVPPLIVLAVAIYLLCIVPRESTKWKTSRLEDLIAIGMASERERNMASSDDLKRKSHGGARGELRLSALLGAKVVMDDKQDLIMMSPASPAEWTQGPKRWVTDAEGTRAIPIRQQPTDT